MKLRLFMMIVFFVGLTGAVFAYISMKPEIKAGVEKTAASSRAQMASDGPLRADAYVDYDYDIIKMTPGTKLLFFHAPWCPQCRSLDKDIASAAIPDDVTIIKVDYDSHQDLRKKYNVSLQTTFVSVDDQGNMVSKYVAYDQPTFAAVKMHLLE